MLKSITPLLFIIFSFIILHYLKSKKSHLSLQILLGLGLGACGGIFLKMSPGNQLLTATYDSLLFIGNAYLALLKMLVVPLVLTSILHAILNLGTGNGRYIKKMSFYSCALLLILTALSSLIGLLVGVAFKVGQGLHLPDFVTAPKHVYTGIVDTLLGMLPSNPFASFAEENTIAIVLFAVLFAFAARLFENHDPEKMDIFRKLISALFGIVKKLTNIVLSITPYGILALMTLLLYDQGMAIFVSMLNFIAAMYAAMLLVILMHSFILLTIKQNPWHYFKKASLPLFVAFTTRSSFGTLPVAEETLRNKFHTNQIVATFVPSVGATIGMNACAGIFPAMLVVMALAILHQPLTLHLILMVMFINAIASLGISGIPGTAYIAATITLTSLNLPYGIVALVQGIDPILDMGRTATNVNGVLTTALVVNKIKPYDT